MFKGPETQNDVKQDQASVDKKAIEEEMSAKAEASKQDLADTETKIESVDNEESLLFGAIANHLNSRFDNETQEVDLSKFKKEDEIDDEIKSIEEEKDQSNHKTSLWDKVRSFVGKGKQGKDF